MSYMLPVSTSPTKELLHESVAITDLIVGWWLP
jgi:hypothetical protein